MLERYQTLLSPSKADTCGMYPSCSEYARQVFSHHPFWKATLLASDRLTRSDHDARFYELIQIAGRKKQYDPPPGISYPSAKDLDHSPKEPVHAINVSLAKAKSDIYEDEQLLDFAMYLHCLGLYDAALVEYLRLIRFYPTSSFSSFTRLQIMSAYYDSQDYLKAAKWAEEELRSERVAVTDVPTMKLWLGASYIRLGNSGRARASLPKGVVGSLELEGKSKLLEGFSYVQDENWSQASSCFLEYGQLTGDRSRSEELANVVNQKSAKRRKSPVVAGFLGVIPGLGYIYTGHYESAFSAVLLDSLLLAASYKSFDKGNTPLGVLLGMVGIGWYAGGIYGSISAAERYNSKELKETMLQLNMGFRF